MSFGSSLAVRQWTGKRLVDVARPKIWKDRTEESPYFVRSTNPLYGERRRDNCKGGFCTLWTPVGCRRTDTLTGIFLQGTAQRLDLNGFPEDLGAGESRWKFENTVDYTMYYFHEPYCLAKFFTTSFLIKSLSDLPDHITCLQDTVNRLLR